MDSSIIEELAQVLRRSSLTRVEISGADWSVEMETGARAAAPAAAPVSLPVSLLDEPAILPDLTYVDAPVVGVFHEMPRGIRPGAEVRAGDVLGYIEALALRNDIRCPVDGQVTAVQVEDGQPVEYGQPLFAIGRFGG